MTETEIQQLLDKLCEEQGYCLSLEDQQRFLDDPPREVLAFADAVFTAEGLIPDMARSDPLYREVRDTISEAFERAEHRRRKRKKLGLCVKCGYDLRASKERCPECGQEFEKS